MTTIVIDDLAEIMKRHWRAGLRGSDLHHAVCEERQLCITEVEYDAAADRAWNDLQMELKGELKRPLGPNAVPFEQFERAVQQKIDTHEKIKRRIVQMFTAEWSRFANQSFAPKAEIEHLAYDIAKTIGNDLPALTSMFEKDDRDFIGEIPF